MNNLLLKENQMLSKLFFLIRPLNVLIAGLSTLIAASLSPIFNYQQQVVYAILSVVFITAAANIVNDIFDIEIDKINKPGRPLAAGQISITSAWIFYVLLNIIGLFFSFIVSLKLAGIAIFAIIILFLYSFYFKKTILVGNLLVSFISGLTFVFATLAIDDFQAGIIPAVFAFFFHFGREILKDIQDLEGDLIHNTITFPGRFGKKKSLLIVNIIFAVLIVFLLSPIVLINYNVYYIYIVLFGVISVLLFVSVSVWFKNDSRWLGKISLLLKIDMFVGLTAIYAGVNLPI